MCSLTVTLFYSNDGSCVFTDYYVELRITGIAVPACNLHVCISDVVIAAGDLDLNQVLNSTYFFS